MTQSMLAFGTPLAPSLHPSLGTPNFRLLQPSPVFAPSRILRAGVIPACSSKLSALPFGLDSLPKLDALPDVTTLPGLAALPPSLATSLAANTIGFAALSASGKRGSILTQAGFLHAYALGVLLWGCLGPQGWLTCVFYLIGGSAVTKVRMKEKEAKGIAEGRGGARGPENVWGSAAAAALAAIGTVLFPKYERALKIGYVASLATKLSDTFASEIGKAFGKRTFLVTTLKPVPPGTEGAVSLEGTLAGVLGSILQAAVGIGLGVVESNALVICIIAAFIANYVESLLGATTQGKFRWLTNEVINFANTAVGAAIGIGMGIFLQV